jgi:hypothetical protein
MQRKRPKPHESLTRREWVDVEEERSDLVVLPKSRFCLANSMPGVVAGVRSCWAGGTYKGNRVEGCRSGAIFVVAG